MGSQEHKTPVVRGSFNPKWNSSMQVCSHLLLTTWTQRPYILSLSKGGVGTFISSAVAEDMATGEAALQLFP